MRRWIIGLLLLTAMFRPVIDWGSVFNTFEPHQKLKPIGWVMGGALINETGINFYINVFYNW